jgi:hypothetical protein
MQALHLPQLRENPPECSRIDRNQPENINIINWIITIDQRGAGNLAGNSIGALREAAGKVPEALLRLPRYINHTSRS